MKTVKFVESLNIKEVPYVSSGVHYFQHEGFKPIKWGDDGVEGIVTDEVVQVKVAPISQFSTYYESGNSPPNERIREDRYIAWSEDVQEFLGTPFDILNSQLKEAIEEKNFLRRSLSKADNEIIRLKSCMLDAGIFKRLKYLFTGVLTPYQEIDK